MKKGTSPNLRNTTKILSNFEWRYVAVCSIGRLLVHTNMYMAKKRITKRMMNIPMSVRNVDSAKLMKRCEFECEWDERDGLYFVR